MREIEFRGFAKMSIDRIIELQIPVTQTGWVYGYLLDGHICGEVIESDDDYIAPSFWVPVVPESVGEYIGTKDKHGIKIYEGDLLSDPYPINEDDLSKGYHESLLPVFWCNEKLRWSVDTSFAKDGTHLTSLVEYFGDELEVKGNVFEKELEGKP